MPTDHLLFGIFKIAAVWTWARGGQAICAVCTRSKYAMTPASDWIAHTPLPRMTSHICFLHRSHVRTGLIPDHDQPQDLRGPATRR
ncbi:hypothetical protein GQ53DRAFT_215995 [Thozetella sp. PMI_491]|nr:hypothetical protein GQ53DRAFT_215995 [Thozetella sp. PMI_491]